MKRRPQQRPSPAARSWLLLIALLCRSGWNDSSLLGYLPSSSSAGFAAAYSPDPLPSMGATSFRPIPADAAQELEDFFSAKGVVDLHDFEQAMMRDYYGYPTRQQRRRQRNHHHPAQQRQQHQRYPQQQQQQRYPPQQQQQVQRYSQPQQQQQQQQQYHRTTLPQRPPPQPPARYPRHYSPDGMLRPVPHHNNNNHYDTTYINAQHNGLGLTHPQQQHAYQDLLSDDDAYNETYESLEERVRQLELQLAQLLTRGIPQNSNHAVGNDKNRHHMVIDNDGSSDEDYHALYAQRRRQVDEPFFYQDEQTAPLPLPTNTPTSETVSSLPPPQLNGNVKSQPQIESMEHGRRRQQPAELPLSSEYVKRTETHNGDKKKKNQQPNPKAATPSSSSSPPSPSNENSYNNNNGKVVADVSAAQSDVFQREEQACQRMSRQQLKSELQKRNIDTSNLFDKKQLVLLLAKVRTKEAYEEENLETTPVEVVTDAEYKHGPWQEQSNPNVHVQDGDATQVGTTSRMPRSQSSDDMASLNNFCSGNGMPDMRNFGEGGGALGGANPLVVAKVRECLANPAAFRKYYSDPDLVAIIREIRQNMP